MRVEKAAGSGQILHKNSYVLNSPQVIRNGNGVKRPGKIYTIFMLLTIVHLMLELAD